MLTPETNKESFKDICIKYDATTIQQLYKKITDKVSNSLVDKNVFPVGLVQAVYDAISGMRLDDILTHFNYINIEYKGTDELTRLAVPIAHRRSKLIIQYTDYEDKTRIEQYVGKTINDNDWQDSNNWIAPFSEGDYTVYVTKEQLQEIIDDDKLNELLKDAIGDMDLTDLINEKLDEVLNEYLKTKDEVINNAIKEYLANNLSEELIAQLVAQAIENQLQQAINNYFASDEGKEAIKEAITPELEEVVGEFFEAVTTYMQDSERVIANALARHEQAITELQNNQ